MAVSMPDESDGEGAGAEPSHQARRPGEAEGRGREALEANAPRRMIGIVKRPPGRCAKDLIGAGARGRLRNDVDL